MRRVIALTLLIGAAWIACVEVPSDIDIDLHICVQHDSVDVAGDSIISLCRVPGEMTMDRYEVGDQVRDKFKEPKPGDQAVTGRIERINPTMIHVRMDDGLLRTMPRATFPALFERLHE